MRTRMDARIDRLTQAQHGVLALWQAADAGIPRHTIRSRVRSGRLVRVVRGVYRVPGAPVTWHQRLHAAVLAAGPHAAASHRAAATLWGLPGFGAGALEAIRRRSGHRRARIGRLHESVDLRPQDVTTRDGIPVTTPARTLLDLGGAITPKRYARAVDNALAMGLVTLEGLRALRTLPGRAGSASLTRILAERDERYVPPVSELEARVLDVISEAAVPMPDRERWLGGEMPTGRVEFFWRDRALVLEADSRRHHMSPLDFEADKRRDSELAAAGFRVMRTTWDEVTQTPGELRSRLRRALHP